MTTLELKHLQLFRDLRADAQSRSAVYGEKLEDFVLDLIGSGASTRSIAEALQVGGTTVQNWKSHAETRRERAPRPQDEPGPDA